MYSIIERNIPDARNELHEMGLLSKDSRPVFQIGSCVVVESVSTTRYVYQVVDLLSGEKKQLYSRKSPLHVAQYDQAAEKILMLPFYSDLDLSSTTDRGLRLIERIFTDILPQHGFTVREKQVELARMIFMAMENRQIALCEAGVGSGKTLAYLVAGIVHGLFQAEKRPFILSTSTIALQKAIMEEYLPHLSDIFVEHRVIEKPLQYVVRKGKAHYVCDLRLQDYKASIDNLDRDNELQEILARLSWAGVTEIDLSRYPLSRYVKDCICVQGLCSASCPKKHDCRFLKYLEHCLTEDCDIQITNHYYTFANVLNLKRGGRGLLPPYQVIIFDEAHKLLEAARQIYGRRLAHSELEDLLSYVPVTRVSDVESRRTVEGWIDVLRERNLRLFSTISTKSLSGVHQEANEPIIVTVVAKNSMVKLIEGLVHLIVLCRRNGDKQMRRILPILQRRCKDLSEKLLFFKDNDDLILWLEVDKDDLILCCIPVDMQHRLYVDMWREGMTFVLTSGTLSVNGDFALLERDVGISNAAPSRLQTACMGSPFDYAQNTLMYIPEEMPFPDIKNPAYVPCIAREVLHLVKATYGHTLILFSSYRVMERVYALIKDEISARYPVFLLKRGRVDILAKFRASGSGVLFASDTAGEGVDLPGDILSSLIIVKLPFAVPDPVSEYERKQFASLQEYQQAVLIPQMLIRLKQHVGRAIRTESDTAVISLLDSRVSSEGKYRSVVLDSLFKTTVVNRISEVKAFIREKKDNIYFEGGD